MVFMSPARNDRRKPPISRKSYAKLSQILDVPKSRIRIIKGHYTRNKMIAIDGLNQPEIMGRLSTYSKH